MRYSEGTLADSTRGPSEHLRMTTHLRILSTFSWLLSICLTIFLVTAGAGCQGNGGLLLSPLAAKERHEFTHDSFGRTIHVTFYTDNPARAEEAIATAKER